MHRFSPAHTAALHKCRLFRDLEVSAIQRLLADSLAVGVARGEVICRKGQPCTGLHIILDGQVKLCVQTPAGEEHVVDLLGEGDAVGEVALVSHRPQLTSAIAITSATLLQIRRQALLAEFERTPRLCWNAVQVLATLAGSQVNDLENLLFRKADSRVARYLVDLFGSAERRRGQVVRLPARKGLIASRLHMTKEHFSRTLRELSERGVVAVRHLDIEILDRAALERIAA